MKPSTITSVTNTSSCNVKCDCILYVTCAQSFLTERRYLETGGVAGNVEVLNDELDVCVHRLSTVCANSLATQMKRAK